MTCVTLHNQRNKKNVKDKTSTVTTLGGMYTAESKYERSV